MHAEINKNTVFNLKTNTFKNYIFTHSPFMQAQVLFGRYIIKDNLSNMPITRRSLTKTALPKSKQLTRAS